jgi:translation initiation factor 2 subunit 1
MDSIDNLPKRDDFVVVRVSQILDYGAFVELLEYNNIKGFVHISNVASSWVKNIRNFVKQNQIRAARVLNVDYQKGQIDLAFSGVNSLKERQTINSFKQYNREEKLVEILAKQTGKSTDVVWAEVAQPLIDEYGSLSSALEKIALGEDVSKVVPSAWTAPIKEMVEKTVVVSQKELGGVVKIKTLSANGLEDIKKIFSTISNYKGISAKYLGAGAYGVHCTSLTYKETEKTLGNFIEELEKIAKKLGAELKFTKTEKA